MNTQSWQCWHFCVASNEYKLELKLILIQHVLNKLKYKIVYNTRLKEIIGYFKI